jgi:putative sigma-54 modulation protein
MKHQISSDNIELTESIKTLAQDKVSKLNRFFKNYPEDAVSLRSVINSGSAEDTFEVHIDATINGKNYFAEERDYSLESTLIKTVEEIEKQLEKARSQNEKEWEKVREMKGVDPIQEETD